MARAAIPPVAGRREADNSQMLIRVTEVLDRTQLEAVRALLAGMRFVDGRVSAGKTARRVKRNEEIPSDDAGLERLNNIVMNALVRHPVYQAAALPARVAAPFYARYREGMGYGDHIDDPVMGGPLRYRSDVAITVFLSEPESYAGGELVVRTTFGEQYVKFPAGDAVLYPASSVHRVERVTRGERLVAVTWVQSLVPDPARRELLYELHQAREALLRDSPDTEPARQVDHAYVNLVRMWAQT